MHSCLECEADERVSVYFEIALPKVRGNDHFRPARQRRLRTAKMKVVEVIIDVYLPSPVHWNLLIDIGLQIVRCTDSHFRMVNKQWQRIPGRILMMV